MNESKRVDSPARILRIAARSAPPRKRRALRDLAAAHEAALAEIAALKARLAAAENLADHDPLIPVLNRRAFLREVESLRAWVQRYGESAAVLYLDLDGFKALNDGFGHGAGDAALRHVGALLRDHVRESDKVGRLGGDEFGVALARASAADAAHKAKALGELIRRAPFEHEGVTHTLRASIGWHGLSANEDGEAALARADEAMYAMKHARRRA